MTSCETVKDLTVTVGTKTLCKPSNTTVDGTDMHYQGPLESLSLEVLLFIAGHLDYLSLIRLAATSKRMSLVLKDDMMFKQMLFINYGVSYKAPDETWREQYEKKWSDTSGRRICPHLSSVTDDILLEKADTFKAAQEHKSLCSKCSMSQFPNLMLVMEKIDHDVCEYSLRTSVRFCITNARSFFT